MAHRSIRTSAPWRPTPTRNRLSQSISLALFTATLATPVVAVEFNFGEIEGRFDSQLSIGTSIRMEDADSRLVSKANLGSGEGSGSYDDANLNFKEGNAFSTVFKGVHDLELNYENYGAFIRGKYWYDKELEDGKRPHGNTLNAYSDGRTLSDNGFNEYARFSGAEILDAYFFGSFELNNQPLDIRLGRQVINWGESTFIQGGLNAINPVDVSAVRRAGVEVKEALLPVNMAFASLGLTDNLSMEAFYQLKWEPTAIDGCGTYFSTNDFGAEGCDGIRIRSTLIPPTLQSDAAYFDTAGGLFVINRHEDGRREADDEGQFGIAFRYFAEELNDTEFGLYFAKYHSRLPISSGVKYLAGGVPGVFTSEYFIEYPEDIEMLGLSFNTTLGTVAWSGEVTHKTNVPIQINGPLLVAAILREGLGSSSGNAAADSLIASSNIGEDVNGYSTFDVTQIQTSFLQFFDNTLGASRLTLIGELGWTHINDFDEGANALKYGRHGTFGYAAGETEGFVTQDSYGYVVRASLNYSDVFAGINLTPQLSLKQGLEGNGPEPGAAFREGESAATFSLTADYLNQYQAQLGYTSFFGGDYNGIEDRDYLSLSASASF
ncbi:DUF1302 domain-containing protein [Amphritea japonica]|uniref:DUF1302 domain-containing protein n=1 Tax=Amphritea japonica ATCC BAA-1530 TaxID=1278309 RepID=A0A7R6SUA1_9GAMM|nr:DUF1302 domain-containing protein [Amphritea japonica]BBB27482.1 conserved hypothetical protein [Amphritea japonica ATCC BAA-1530]